MFIITTQNPAFGKGYFIGFDNDGFAHFQSCLDKRVKKYKNRTNAQKQLARIQDKPAGFKDTATYSIEGGEGENHVQKET